MNRISKTALNIARSSMMTGTSAHKMTANRALSVEGTWKKKGTAIEEEYFKRLAEREKKLFSESVHKKELASLLEILPENHKLSPETLLRIVEWKHKP